MDGWVREESTTSHGQPATICQEEDPNEDRPQQTKIAKDNKVDYRAKKKLFLY